MPQFMDFYINPLGPKNKSYTRESMHIINMLNSITDPPTNTILCTLDVNSIYTSISHQEGIKFIQKILAIHRTPPEIPNNIYTVELLRVPLENRYFAIGTEVAPFYGN